MAFKRKIYDELLRWKNEDNGSTALLIEGCRRVGKSTIVEEFAKNEYKSYLLINFDEEGDEIKEVFKDGFRNLDAFYSRLSAYFGNVSLYPRKSIIIFDEVQKFPRAREGIKFFVKDGRFDFIETGSLITMRLMSKNITLPSEERKIIMNPMDYEEFLWAMDDFNTVPFLKKSFEERKPLSDPIHRKQLKQFMEYMVVGGMPQAVQAYLGKKYDFNTVDRKKREILSLYENDLHKYDTKNHTDTAEIFNNVPSNLTRHEKKFKFSSLGANQSYFKLKGSLENIKESHVVNACYNSTSPELGLSLNKEASELKLYLLDTGLFITQSLMDKITTSEDIYRKLIFGNLSINQGMFFENIVAQMLVASGHQLFFHTFKDKALSPASRKKEIDFLIVRDGKISPVEVKSSNYRNHKSLDVFKEKYKTKKIGESFILYTNDLHKEDNLTYLPVYMTMFL